MKAQHKSFFLYHLGFQNQNEGDRINLTANTTLSNQIQRKRFLPEPRRKRKDISMFENEYVECTLPRQKNIALIAHDNKKPEIIDWCLANKTILEHHFLCGTGTTAKMIAEKTGLPIRGFNSGPLGGAEQIGARIVDGKIDLVIFFSDPLEAQPHDPDVKALLRIAQVFDIPIANNRATADFIINSKFMDTEYTRKLINFRRNVDMRAKEL